jgi:uncharacterized membrane protein
MEWILLVGVAVAVVVLFVSNSRMRGEVDTLIKENKIQSSSLTRLEGLYAALLAARHGSAPAAPPPPVTPAPPAPAPAEAPAAPSVTEPLESLGDTPPASLVPEVTPQTPAAPETPPPPPTTSAPPPPPLQAAAAMSGVPPVRPTPKRFEWERFVGVNLPVWIGAVALCIAGYFFVSYAIESGFFTPEFRVLAGVVAGLAFLAFAQFVRLRVKGGTGPAIAAALATAGVATLYAVSYIASVTYALVPQTIGFVAMIGVTVLAVAVAFVFGQAVAIVGLIGGYLTPALVPSDAPSALTLFGYLIAIHIAMFGVLRVRNWWHLSPLALAGPAIWVLLWSSVGGFETQPWPAVAFLILVPIVAAAAAADSWLSNNETLWLVGGKRGWDRRALPLAMLVAAFGFVVFLQESAYALPFWQGLVAFAAISVVAAFARPVSLGYLQLIAFAGAAFALLAHPVAGFAEIGTFVAIFAVIFGFGALDQLRRLRRADIWASAIAVLALFFLCVALFKIAGWQSALENKHLWAAAALALAAGLVALLFVFGPRIADEKERSRAYAALGAGVTSLVSLAVVLELDPSLFPVASALGVLGLAAVHSRVPVRGLRVLAAVYAIVYGLLIVGSAADIAQPGTGLDFVLAPSLATNPLVLLILPGIALFLAATVFRRARPAAPIDVLSEALDVASVVAVSLGILYLAKPPFWEYVGYEAYILGAQISGPLALVAGVAIFFGKRMARRALYYAGLALALLVALAMLVSTVAPIYRFWPTMDLPGFGPFDVAYLALGVPAVIFILLGRFLRINGENNVVVNYGRGLAAFGVVAIYTLLLVEIRRAYHGGSAENYTYSAATLVFGIVLLLVGVIIQNPLPRVLSLLFVLAATVKVFLFDASSLEGLWRVLSFLGMGLSFLGISWAYARYVFGIGRNRPPPAPEVQPSAST